MIELNIEDMFAGRRG